MAAKKTAKQQQAETSVDDTVSPVRKTAAKSPAKKGASKPSLEAVARAAYLNYRRRVERGLPGDSHGDWLAAERELDGQS